MSLKTTLHDGWGTENKLKINGEGEASVVVHPHPPKGEIAAPLPYREYMTRDGDGSTIDMRVAASSANPIEFSLNAYSDRDIYVARISFVISDAGASLSDFGAIASLTNGIDFKWVTQEFGTVVIDEAMKSNFDFIRLAGGKPAFGSGTSSFRANNVEGTSEAFIPVVDFDEIFGLQWGFRLRKGTTDKIIITINDDITAIDRFDAIGYGIRW